MQTKVFAVFALLLIGGVTYQFLRTPSLNPENNIQRQEEQEDLLIDIFYQSEDEYEERMVDLLWLQRAAQTVLERGDTYFNVVEQNFGTRQFEGKDLTYIEGIIEITDDINAEFHAEEVSRVNIEEL